MLVFFFFFFFIINLYFLIATVITHIFNPTVELVIPIGIPAKEEKAEIETYPLTVGVKTTTFSI